MNQIVNTYDIEKTKWQKDGVVDVQVKFEGKDLASFDPSVLDKDANTYMESYLVENQDRLTALYEEKGEQEAYKVILDELTKRVDKHNNTIERTYRLEEQVALHEEKLKVANHRIQDLENKEE